MALALWFQILSRWSPCNAERSSWSDREPGIACTLCDRQPSSCRRIAGLYTVVVLKTGTYNPVVEIPPQACSINITELARSHNYLAVKTDRGDNVFNSEWALVSPGSYPGAGTDFTYDRGAAKCPGECVRSPGPTESKVIVQLLSYNKNPGVAYSFLLPNHVPFLPFAEVAPQVSGERLSYRHPLSASEPNSSGSRDALSEFESHEEPQSKAKTERGRSGRPILSRQPITHSRRHGESPSPLSSSQSSSSSATSASSSSSYSPSSHSAHLRQRLQPPAHISAYETEWARKGQESFSGASGSMGRGGLVDMTFSRSLQEPESLNRLTTWEHAVERRPNLVIGKGGGGKEYEWTISGFNECSLTCGGGVQETEIVCVLTTSGTQVVVTPDNCENALKPKTQRVPCNNEPCQPGWVTGEYAPCSVTCGGGTQSRRVECRQRFSATVGLSVSASQCHQDQKPAVAQQCNNDPCSEWKAGQWGKCSTECGGGERERQVVCVDGKGFQIPAAYCSETKPANKESCNTQPCNTQWLHSLWSEQCSTSCGSGSSSRHVICTDRTGHPVAEDVCNREHRPRDRKRCESNVGCGNSWFTGPWSECSESCGQGMKSRPVVCMKREDGGKGLTPLAEDQCPADSRPATEEACFSSQCGAEFYITAWSQCSVTCGTGVRTREVRCLDEKQQPSRLCDRSHTPKDREVCKLTPCTDDQRPQEVRDRTEEDAERPQQTGKADSDCKDIFWNCRMVVQARLCHLYGYYRNVCCSSCRKVL